MGGLPLGRGVETGTGAGGVMGVWTRMGMVGVGCDGVFVCAVASIPVDAGRKEEEEEEEEEEGIE